ncbi:MULTISPECIES: lysophospholipid acyltransferase family protein [Chromobacterium]|uniref:Lysophospholipid acyltransferase family protein n=2 Tax=Chromobacterium TaxID=535 RepID=A0ABS3GTU5_9NEIS|nr:MULTISPECIES: lysophospholipid acyltransferase family protein [Chromobacterium]AXT47926.1 lysophospholipid acyltransferase family protein [Chromobacterium rhizoryzae]MBK0416408.1 lysophospholipid acyltransferase family protein [Chromobacterium haemolyticum]MBO0417638.1 lysophospholipid acyltransferase family protein [Chromobacterium haemolyticum]MBO0500830.1 lysophospholipid acyltransferase family protein [Chromobacterium haemolyticum]MDH0342306.1 lysophospholipid acyltransferase family pro
MSKLVHLLLSFLAHLPLSWLQGLGAVLGRLTYHASPRYRARLRENLSSSKICGNYQLLPRLVKQSAAETGKGALELAIAWCREPDDIAAMVKSCTGWEHVEAALAKGHGIVFVTPHLGSYDIAGRYISSRLPFPLTAMYRPPKLSWLEPVMQAGRARGKGKTAPATGAGVRVLMKALKSGEATIILPDQVPGNGEGVWAPFFERPAYTMTLVPRLAQISGVETLFFVGERLPCGQGFRVHIEPPAQAFSGDKEQDAAQLNAQVEALIRRFPSQYLWSYNRYKCPPGVSRPDTQ